MPSHHSSLHASATPLDHHVPAQSLCLVMQVELAVRHSEKAARMVKAKIEKTVLGQVAAHIKAVLQPTAGFVSICLDLIAINRLQLIINPRSVALALLKHSKLKLKADMIRYHPVSLCYCRWAVSIDEQKHLKAVVVQMPACSYHIPNAGG